MVDDEQVQREIDDHVAQLQFPDASYPGSWEKVSNTTWRTRVFVAFKQAPVKDDSDGLVANVSKRLSGFFSWGASANQPEAEPATTATASTRPSHGRPAPVDDRGAWELWTVPIQIDTTPRPVGDGPEAVAMRQQMNANMTAAVHGALLDISKHATLEGMPRIRLQSQPAMPFPYSISVNSHLSDHGHAASARATMRATTSDFLH